MQIKPRSAAQGLAFVIASILAGSAAAEPPQTFNYGVDAGIAETDNVTLSDINKKSQTMTVVDADFDYKQQTRLLDAQAKGDFSYLDYLQGAYGAQLVGRFDGALHASIIQDKLTWFVQDNFGQAALDPFQPTTPNNLENVNYFSTGPDLTLNLGPTGFFDLSARYAHTSYQTSPYNSNRLQGSGALGMQLSARSSVSLNADTERVMFTNTVLNQDFDRTNAFARYDLKAARTEFDVDLGGTHLEQGNESNTGGLARLTASRKLSSASSVNVTAGHVLTDAGSSFSSLASGAIGVVGTAPAPQTANSYNSNYVSAGWDYTRGRTKFDLSARYERDIYGHEPDLNVNRGGGEFRLVRQITRSFEGEILGRFYKTKYPNETVATVAATAANNTNTVGGSPDYDDELIAASLAWRYGRGLEIKLRAEHDARVTFGNDQGYKDNRAFLTIGYRPRSTDSVFGDPSGV